MDFKDLSIPPVLYHYTSWDTFEKIVKNHTWRFSSINGTNDLSEDLNLYVKQLLDDKDLISNINLNTKQDILDHIDTDNYYGFKNYFIACFSSVRDDLGQWRTSYGDYGRGVCIGINPKFFTKHIYLNKTIETLRDLHDETGIPIVLVGMSLAKHKLKKHTHLFDRISEIYQYTEFEYSDIKQIVDEISEVDMTKEVISVIHQKAKSFRKIVEMINTLENIALVNGIKLIDENIIQEVFR